MTLDAAGSQVAIARQIWAAGGGDRRAVKGNQPGRSDAVDAALGRAGAAGLVGVAFDHHTATEGRHGRHEERSVSVLYDPTGRPADGAGAGCQGYSEV